MVILVDKYINEVIFRKLKLAVITALCCMISLPLLEDTEEVVVTSTTADILISQQNVLQSAFK